MQKVKVFCIGFHKTGTTSLGAALTLLGYKNCHGAGPARKQLGETKMMELLFRKEYAPFYEIAENFDSFNDNPWFSIYKELDIQFPGSKFILMLRDENEWIKSCIKYFGSSSSPFRLWRYGKGSPIGNEELYIKTYRQHNEDVIQYFKNRPDDLLVLSLEDTGKIEKIQHFLHLDIIPVDYPYLNRS